MELKVRDTSRAYWEVKFIMITTSGSSLFDSSIKALSVTSKIPVSWKGDLLTQAQWGTILKVCFPLLYKFVQANTWVCVEEKHLHRKHVQMTGFYGLDIPEFHKIYKDPIKRGRKPIKPQVVWNETFSPSGNQPALIKTEFKGKKTNAIEQSLWTRCLLHVLHHPSP